MEIDNEYLLEPFNNKIEEIFEHFGIDPSSIVESNGFLRTCCPVHGGNNSTAFSYSPKTGRWKCWTKGCHNEGSDFIYLVSKLLERQSGQNCTIEDARLWIESKLGISQTPAKPLTFEEKYIRSVIKRDRPQEEHKNGIKIPISELDKTIKPSEYFLSQGYSLDILKRFRVGFCDDRTKPMYMRNFAPVLDETGQYCIGVTGRIKYEKCEFCDQYHKPGPCAADQASVKSYPKWLHYGFKTKNTLYNEWNAAEHIQRTKSVVIVEGTKNCWWLEQAGIHNSVCIFGLNLLDEQLEKLVKYGAINLITGLDNDIRGRDSTQNIKYNFGKLFNIYDMNHFIPDGKDISNIPQVEVSEKIKPWLKKWQIN